MPEKELQGKSFELQIYQGTEHNRLSDFTQKRVIRHKTRFH